MKTQLEFLKEIVALLEEKPARKVIFMVDDEIVHEDFGWSSAVIKSIDIRPYYLDDDRIMDDEDEIIQHLSETSYVDVPDDDEAIRIAEKYFEKEVADAIYVSLAAGVP